MFGPGSPSFAGFIPLCVSAQIVSPCHCIFTIPVRLPDMPHELEALGIAVESYQEEQSLDQDEKAENSRHELRKKG